MDQVTDLKCVAVGDRCVGKSSLFSTFTDNELYHEEFDFITSALVIVDGKPIRLTMSDTIDDTDDAKGLSNQPTDVILLCFSLVNAVSFENVLNKWHPLVWHYYPKTPVILVGTKLDLRGYLTSITTEQGELSATKIKAVKYLECSALVRPSVQVVVEEAARIAFKSCKKNKQKCKII